MSSILLVSDYRMIEYHRLNGNQKINFWRPKDQRNINNLSKSDLVFFLAHSENKGLRNTKGVVGYGRFVRERSMNFNNMWKEYGDKNGYSDKNSLKEAILEYTKTIPTKIKCLEIDDVTIFNAPIQLEEVGLKDANRLESFMYLDRNDEDNTYNLLKKAKEVGIDFWNLEVNSVVKLTMFEEDLASHQLMQIIKKVGENSFSKNEISKIKKMALALEKEGCIKLTEVGEYQFRIVNDEVEMHIISPANIKERNKIKELVGSLQMFKCLSEEAKINFVIHADNEVAIELEKYIDKDNTKIATSEN